MLIVGFAGDLGIVIIVAQILAPAFVALPASIIDMAFVRPRRRTHPALMWSVVGLAALVVARVAFPGFLDFVVLPRDAMFLYGALGLVVIAERLAAHHWLVWRDAALGAAAGIAIVIAFAYHPLVELVAWSVLVLLLALPLSNATRLSLFFLAGLPAMGLGGFFGAVWLARSAEWIAFLAYGGASYMAWRRHTRKTAGAAGGIAQSTPLESP